MKNEAAVMKIISDDWVSLSDMEKALSLHHKESFDMKFFKSEMDCLWELEDMDLISEMKTKYPNLSKGEYCAREWSLYAVDTYKSLKYSGLSTFTG